MEKIISNTPLHTLHKRSGAKMAPFAGYDMPISYPLGTLKEHLWCRENAGIFDVSHMGQFMLMGEAGFEYLSNLTPTNFTDKALGKNIYTLLMNEKGGVRDDLIASRLTENKIYVVVNAACKMLDKAYILQKLPMGLVFEELTRRALVAIQGPKAAEILQRHVCENLNDIPYMSIREMNVAGHACLVSRCGYTGEDGFEISVDNDHAEHLWQEFEAHPAVEPIGLAARDSLRLEAGFALYGHDLDETTTPKEAGLNWVISPNHTNFIGADVLKNPATKKRVGIKLIDKGIAREGSELFNADDERIGILTSGGHSPSLKCAIGQGYIDIAYAEIGTEIFVSVRNRKLKAVVQGVRFIKRK
ncbi:MAG: aminomethyltransferase [Alphaproteobacteria bacterium]|jgi:aminomethyltransferase